MSSRSVESIAAATLYKIRNPTHFPAGRGLGEARTAVLGVLASAVRGQFPRSNVSFRRRHP